MEIWFDESNTFVQKLREKHRHVKGKCGRCAFKEVCSGFRLRALRVYGDPWQEDPACYLSEEEIRIDDPLAIR